MATRVYVGIGSNIERKKNIWSGLKALQIRYGKIAISPIYETRAIGLDGDFFNLVAGFNTRHDIGRLEKELHLIEFEHGRHKNETRFCSRTLDIDLLLYGNLVSLQYKVPREDITRYAFVIKPLLELAPDLVHPVTGKTIAEIWNEFKCDQNDIKRVIRYNAK